MSKKLTVALGCVLVPSIIGGACWWWALGGHSASTASQRGASWSAGPGGVQRARPSAERRPAPPSATSMATRSPADETQEPHPLTPAHEAMAERREVIGALREAMQEQRYERARVLLATASALARAATDDLAFDASVHGYRLILECLEARAARERAGLEVGGRALPESLLFESRRYLEQQRMTPRRDVRRVCLEGQPFARRG